MISDTEVIIEKGGGIAGTIDGGGLHEFTPYDIYYSGVDVPATSGSIWDPTTFSLTPTPNATTRTDGYVFVNDGYVYMLYIHGVDGGGMTTTPGAMTKGYAKGMFVDFNNPYVTGTTYRVQLTYDTYLITTSFDPTTFTFTTAGSIAKTQIRTSTSQFWTIKRASEQVNTYLNNENKPAIVSHSSISPYGVLLRFRIFGSSDVYYTSPINVVSSFDTWYSQA